MGSAENRPVSNAAHLRGPSQGTEIASCYVMLRKDGASSPELEGSIVRFDSYREFRAHYRAHIAHAGLLVRSDPLSIGTRRKLKLHVEEVQLCHEVEGFVVFRGGGLVGFAIEDFQRQKPLLRALAEE